MAQDRCSALAILAIEAEITTSLDFEKIINDFVTSESKEKKFWILYLYYTQQLIEVLINNN